MSDLVNLLKRQWRLKKIDSTGCVRSILRYMDDLHCANLDYIADLFNICPRSFQKRLRKENTHFTQLLNEERRFRCIKLLSEGATLTIIVDELGFSDIHSLYRAYQHWTGENISVHTKILRE